MKKGIGVFFRISSTISWIIMLLIVLPILVMIFFSFNPSLSFYTKALVLKWYSLQLHAVLATLKTSLYIAFPAVLLSFLVSLPFCYAIVRFDFKLKDVLSQIIVLPMIIPGTILGFTFLQYFNTSILRFIHPLLVLILAHTVVVTPFMARSILAGLEEFDVTLEEAALTLGASAFKAFISITVRVISPSILAGVILSLARSLNDFIITLFLIEPNYVPLSVLVYKTTMYGLPQLTSATSTILLCLSLGLALLAERIVEVRPY